MAFPVASGPPIQIDISVSQSPGFVTPFYMSSHCGIPSAYPNACYNGWMNGWMDGWMDEQMDLPGKNS
jgi:hypothetical protein